LKTEDQSLSPIVKKHAAKGGKKEAFLGGEVSEYIRANTTIKKKEKI
jgi:hypothetical protein